MGAPFRRGQTAAAGLRTWDLRGPHVRREHHGVYSEAYLEPDLALRIAAARLVLPADVLVDGSSALQMMGIDLGEARPLRFVTVHPHQVRRPGLRVRRTAKLPPAWSDAPEGSAPCVAPAAAFVAAASVLDLVDLVAAGDWLVRLGLASWAELVDEAARCRGRHALLARRAAGLVRDRVDSPQETRLRLCLVLAGLPAPEVNPVVTAHGRRVGRVDLLLRRWRVVVEYDGDQHRTDPRQWDVDIARQEHLGDGEWQLVRVTNQRMDHPRTVVALVVRALRAGGWDGADPVFDEEWHRLFPTAP